MMVKSLDRRAKLTRKILKQSLIELMKDKPLHEISIKKICETADINRSTFYHHYNSQYELFDDIFNDIGTDIYAIVEKNIQNTNWLQDVLSETFEYLENDRDTVLIILSQNSGLGIGEKLSHFLERFFAFNSASAASSYCALFISSGITSIVWKWLNKAERLPAKQLAQTITALVYQGIGDDSVFTMK